MTTAYLIFSVLGVVVVATIIYILTNLFKKDKLEKEKLIKINYDLKKTQENFLQNMSHELRTPLTAIKGYTDVLSTWFHENSFDIKYTETLDLIKQNENYLGDRINLILNYSKIKSGAHIFQSCELNSVNQFIKSAADPFYVICQTKKINLIIHIQPNMIEHVRMNFLGTEFILNQIISNAVKFTAQGQVKIQVSQDLILKKINIQISDTGCGIEAKNLKNIFKSFYQAESSSVRQIGGLGLGLAVCQLMARQMNADLTVESEIHHGTTFKLVIPYLDKLDDVQENTKTAIQNLEIPGRIKKIILAEDNPDNRLVIESFLKKIDVNVSIAENGHEAVVQILQAEKEKDPFDLVLMDMQMPIMDGFQATRMLRQRGLSVPIIAVTAHNLIGDREKCLAAGCTDYLAKPVHLNIFLKTINSYLSAAKPILF